MTHSARSILWPRCVSAILLLCVTVGSSKARDWQTECQQAVIVVTDNWSATGGKLFKFQKRTGRWKKRGNAIPVTVGRNGLGWGIGLHRERTSDPQKNEGDKRAPAGIFRLEFGFGAMPFEAKRFPYRQVFERDRWVDDSSSTFYNQWVVEDDSRFPKDWTSAETLKRPDGIYDYAISVAHNRSRIQRERGSAIFIHSWFGPGRATIGCTAMEKTEVRSLLIWLDAALHPVLIQVPVKELPGLNLPTDLSEELRQLIIK